MRRHGTRDGNAAALPSRQCRGHAIDELGESDKAEDLLHPSPDVVQRHIGFLIKSVADVLRYRERIEERQLLEHDSHVGAYPKELSLAAVVDAFPIDDDGA